MNDRRSSSRRFRLFVSVATPLAVAFAIHCGSEERSRFDDGCTDWFGDQCGKACADDTQCGAGLFCASDKKCNAQCAPNSTCSDGVACSAKGRCGSDPPPGGSSGFVVTDSGSNDNDGSLDTDSSCADINVTLDKVKPTVLLLIDQSQSMTDFDFPLNSGTTRWNVLRSTLINPTDGVVKQLENDVAFGLTLYSWRSGGSGGACPRLTNVSWKLGNYTDIATVYNAAATIDNTPTADSIMSVVGFNNAGVLRDGGFASAVTPGPKIILLATDGDPDTCAGGGLDNGDAGAMRSVVWATERTYDAGISTYVISVGTDLDQAHQQQVANVGQGKKADAGAAVEVFRPTTRQQLVDALNKIITGVRSCTFTLNGSVVPGTESRGVVTLNGAPLEYNGANGWKLNSPKELEIVGESCKTVKTTLNAQVSVRFPCGTVVPDPK